MTPAEIAALATPLSEEEPSGPDLEMLGDADYMRFTARIDGVLPKTFASFDRASIDFPAEFATLKALLSQSRDLRLLAPLAKLHVLNRDLAGYAAVFKLIESLLDGAWPSVVPALIDGDAVLRIVTLQTLDDMADSVMPLQSAPLFETRRFGKVSYRSHLLASGQIQPREGADGAAGEEVPSATGLSNALGEVDLNMLVAARNQMTELQQSIARIESLTNDKSDQPGALQFERLRPLVRDIASYLDQSVAARDPSLSLAGAAASAPVEEGADDAPEAASSGAAAPAVRAGAVNSTIEAQAALAAAATYFAQSEPSSPILMLIGQAQALVGRGFYETLQVLLPDEFAKARLRIGQEPGFVLMFERLAALSGAGSGQAEEQPAEATYGSESEEQPAEASPESEEQSSDGESNPEATDGSAEASPPPPVSAPAPAPNLFQVGDRRSAMALLQQVSAHFRRAEPSSPIPLLLDRADGIAGKDFFSILRETFPASSLKVDEQPS